MSVMTQEQPWPFDQPSNCAAVTTRQVLGLGMPVLLVAHDADDHGWQFLHGDASDDSEEGRIIGMGEALKLDPTLREVADLPPGWQATREHPGAPWRRFLSPPDLRS